MLGLLGFVIAGCAAVFMFFKGVVVLPEGDIKKMYSRLQQHWEFFSVIHCCYLTFLQALLLAGEKVIRRLFLLLRLHTAM
ncbi:hypothetical protein ACFTAO_50460 [Paenibacillus rhizoplanae]